VPLVSGLCLGLGLGLGESPAEEGEDQQQQQQVPAVAVSVGCNPTPQKPYLCWPYSTVLVTPVVPIDHSWHRVTLSHHHTFLGAASASLRCAPPLVQLIHAISRPHQVK
jgi:hypothetical protein